MISREIGWSNQNNLTFGIIQQVNKIQKEVCCNCNISTTTTTTTVFRNFDVTAQWGLATPAVTSPATFKTFLESGQDGDGNTNDQTGVVVTDFLLVGNRLRCYVSSTGGSNLAFSFMNITDATSFGNLQITGYLYLYSNNIPSVDNTSWPIGVNDIDLGNNSITSFDNVTWPSSLTGYLGLYSNGLTSFNPVTPLPNGITTIDLGDTFITSFDDVVWPSDLQYLYLYSTAITSFDPSTALPSGLLQLELGGNALTNFDPSITLPSSLQSLALNTNNLTSFDPSIALPSSLVVLYLYNNTLLTSFDPSVALPNSLQVLSLSNNQIVTFDPSIALPSGLQTLYLYNNQMTTAGYTGSEPWANAMSVIPGRGSITFATNPDSASGTNLETILIAKGWTVSP